MDDFTKKEFEMKNVSIDNFFNETHHYRELILNENHISIPLSWRTYQKIQDNKQANAYLEDLIRESYRMINKIKNISEKYNFLEYNDLKEIYMRPEKKMDYSLNDIKILNDELNRYIFKIKEFEEIIIKNNGYIRNELKLDDVKFVNGKYYCGFANEIDKIDHDCKVREYYLNLL